MLNAVQGCEKIRKSSSPKIRVKTRRIPVEATSVIEEERFTPGKTVRELCAIPRKLLDRHLTRSGERCAAVMTDSKERPELQNECCQKEGGGLKAYWEGVLARVKQQIEAESSTDGQANEVAPHE